MSADPYSATWVAPGDPAAVQSVVVNAMQELGGRRSESPGDVLFNGVVAFRMEAHVIPNAQRHPAMTAHIALGPGLSDISTRVTLTLTAAREREASTTRFTNRCIEIVTSVQQATGSVPEPG